MNLLGAALYDPAVAVSKATSALLAMTAVDTTNLRLAITVPAHGLVRFRMRCIATGATTVPVVLLGVMNGATVIGRVAPAAENATANVATQNFLLDAEFTVSGLAAGAMNVDAAYAVQVVVAATNIKYGGPNTNAGANAWGAFVFEAWDPRPIPTATPGAANGLQICGSNAATTYATLTSTGALTVNGVAAVSQTGDNFTRIGAAGAGLTALGDTRIANLDATVSSRTKPADTQAAVTTVTNLTNAPTAGDLTAAMKTSVTTAATAATPVAASVTGAVGSVTGLTASNLDAAVSTRLATAGYTAPLTAATTRSAVGLASASLDTQLATIAGYIDTEVGDILAAVDTEVAAIKAKTDQLTFGVAGQVDTNVKSVRGTLMGSGTGTTADPWGP